MSQQLNKVLFANVDFHIKLYYLSTNDAASIYELINNNRSYLRTWLSWVDNSKSVDDCVHFMSKRIEDYKNKNSLVLSVFYNNNIIGLISFHKIDLIEKIGWIGYWIDKEYQGKGIVTKACRSIMNYGFHTLNFEKIMIRCAVGNYRSQAVPKRLQFKQEENMREKEWLYDHYVDLLLFSMTKEDWDKRI